MKRLFLEAWMYKFSMFKFILLAISYKIQSDNPWKLKSFDRKNPMTQPQNIRRKTLDR